MIPINTIKNDERQRAQNPSYAGSSGQLLEMAFGSYHPVGAGFAFADGSVRWLSDDLDMTVYCALATRAGGETTGDY